MIIINRNEIKIFKSNTRRGVIDYPYIFCQEDIFIIDYEKVDCLYRADYTTIFPKFFFFFFI